MQDNKVKYTKHHIIYTPSPHTNTFMVTVLFLFVFVV